MGDSGPTPRHNILENQGRRWTIVFVLVVGIMVYLLLGGASSDDRCGDSPPYTNEEARLCFVLGYDGPMNSANLLPFLDVSLDDARELADEQGWTIYVRRRNDGLEPDRVSDDERPDRLGVQLADGLVVRVWPG